MPGGPRSRSRAVRSFRVVLREATRVVLLEKVSQYLNEGNQGAQSHAISLAASPKEIDNGTTISSTTT